MDQVFDLAVLAAAAPLDQPTPPIARLDGREVHITRFSSHPRWEINPASGKLLMMLAGRMELTVLSSDGAMRHVLAPGEIITIERGTWHSPVPLGEVTTLTFADYTGTRTSDAETPPGD